MDLLAIGLVVFSAVLHAGWNILGKSNSGSGLAFTMAASFSACAILTPYLIWYLATIGWTSLPSEFWGLLFISGISQMVYLVGLIAAIGTTGYSVVDKEALSLLTEQASEILSDHYSAIFYLGVQFWAIGIPALVWCLVTGKSGEIKTAWQIRKTASMAGVMMASTYGLVLFAMTMTDNVSLVVALRQISIVFGLFMGIYFLGEKWCLTRSVGITLMITGLIHALK
ncbi:EamA family transporter [Vibrio sp. M260112]|uniref:EamA family transporter n=1 Tax=Vibrio sp. M260112 TaxID=3020895 RepID=UPI002F3F1B9D